MEIQDVVEKAEFLGGVCSPARKVCCFSLACMFQFIAFLDITVSLARVLVIGYYYDEVFTLELEGFYLIEIIWGFSMLGVLFGLVAFCGIRRRSVDVVRFYSLCKHGQVFTMPFILLVGFLV
jgi:hypothetical protein